MSKTFLELLTALRNTSNKKEIIEISENLGNSIAEDDSYTNYFLYDLLSSVTIRNFDQLLSDFDDKDFYDVQVRSYIDDDSRTKVTVLVTFLQDYENHVEGLEHSVIVDIVESLENENLSLLVNDIVVNTIQFRDGKKVLE